MDKKQEFYLLTAIYISMADGSMDDNEISVITSSELFKPFISAENIRFCGEKITNLLKEKLDVITFLKDELNKADLNKTESKTLVGGFTSNDLGNEIGFICRIRNSPTFVEAFNLSIAKNTYGSVRFRLNFYSLNQGMPNENLLDETIMIETDIESGRVSIDLKPYDIVMDDDFLVSIEWIEDLGSGELLFSAGFFGSNLYARATSQGTWTQMGVAAYGMNVEVVY